MTSQELFKLESLQKTDTIKVSCSKVLNFLLANAFLWANLLKVKGSQTLGVNKCNFIEALLSLDILQTRNL